MNKVIVKIFASAKDISKSNEDNVSSFCIDLLGWDCKSAEMDCLQ